MFRVHLSVRLLKLAVFVLVLLSLIASVHAQVVIDNLVDSSLIRYQIRFEFIGDRLVGLMLNTFYLLAVIEFTWAMITLMLKQAGMQAFLSTIVTRSLFIGFFSWLLTRGSATASEVFQSFEQLAIATTLTDGAITPSNIMDHGQVLWARLYQEAISIGIFDSVFDPNKSLSTPVLLLFIGMVAFVVMAIIAAHFAVVLLEMFIAANAGIILLGLGASRWTYQYATAYLRYALSVGMKLFVLSIVVGLTLDEIDRFFATAAIDEINNLMALLAFILFAAVVSIIVPKSVKGMMDGVSVGTAGTVASAISARHVNSRPISRSTGQLSKMFLPK